MLKKDTDFKPGMEINIEDAPKPAKLLFGMCPDCDAVHVVCLDAKDKCMVTFKVTDEILEEIIALKKRGYVVPNGIKH